MKRKLQREKKHVQGQYHGYKAGNNVNPCLSQAPAFDEIQIPSSAPIQGQSGAEGSKIKEKNNPFHDGPFLFIGLLPDDSTDSVFGS